MHNYAISFVGFGLAIIVVAVVVNLGLFRSATHPGSVSVSARPASPLRRFSDLAARLSFGRSNVVSSPHSAPPSANKHRRGSSMKRLRVTTSLTASSTEPTSTPQLSEDDSSVTLTDDDEEGDGPRKVAVPKKRKKRGHIRTKSND